MSNTVRNLLVGLAVSANLAMSATALTTSLTHAGPQGVTGKTGAQGPIGKTGPQGLAGVSGKSASTSGLGVCVTYTTNTSGYSSVTFVSGVTSPSISGGVASCYSGTFTPVTPQ